MDELKDEIVFLEAELLDDDDDAPVGTLISVGDEEPVAQEAPAEEPIAEEPVAEEEPVQAVEEEPIAEETPAEEPVEEPVAEEKPAEEPHEEPAPVEDEAPEEPASSEEALKETPTEEPVAEDVPEEPAPEEAPQEAPAEEPTEAPAHEEPAKPKKPRAKKSAEEPTPAPTKKRAATAISLDEHNVNHALADSSFEVKDSKPATIVKSKKVKEDDVWQVAPVANKAKKEEPKAEEPKKAPAKKVAPKAAPKAEEPAKQAAKPAPKKAPAKKAEAPKAEETPKQNTKPTEEKKMAAKEVKPAPAPKKADDKDQEKVLVAGNPNAPHGKFVIKVTSNGNYVYKLFASNKRVVAIGAQPYPALPSCKTGIQSVIKNAGSAPIEDQTLQKPVEQKCPKWIIYLDKKGEFRLRLIASNGNIVATTNDGYLSKAAAKQGIDAIARASVGADIVRNDNLW